MWKRFASLPIRNAGTLGGNIANGSPIGDSMPGLIALGAHVIVRGNDVSASCRSKTCTLHIRRRTWPSTNLSSA